MQPAFCPPKPTIYYDGSCPVCSAEIGYYQGKDRAQALCFVDVSRTEVELPAGLTRQQAMARFHVRGDDGRLSSGAAAFAAVWARLPGWRWAARCAALPGVLVVLEFGYRLFLLGRPLIVRILAPLLRRKFDADRLRR